MGTIRTCYLIFAILLLGLQIITVFSGCNSCSNSDDYDSLLEKVKTLQNRMDKWDNKCGNCQQNYNSLESKLGTHITKEDNDFNTVRRSCNDCQSNIKILFDRTSTCIGNQEKVYIRVADLETGRSDVQVRVVRLESANQVWKSNFRVVNRTFTEIKKSIRTTNKQIGWNSNNN